MKLNEIYIHKAQTGQLFRYKVLGISDEGFLFSMGNNFEIELGWFKSLEEFTQRFTRHGEKMELPYLEI